ncbi:MAG TPA: TatD family hydrolase [Gaiellales bacterium]|nr:TatD family hydrolase [Gaiellales bacterium]
MIDTHAHLDGCDAPPEEVAEEAAAAGVRRILTIGREQAVEIAERLDGVWAVVGWHPHEADAARVEELVPLLDHPRVCALGECGLDFFRDNAPRDVQRRVFAAQIELANDTGKPLVIHTRDADEETFPMLEVARVDVVLHCFSSPERVEDAAERGYYCSFAGNVTYPAAEALREAARRVPADRILAETDSPYLAPVPLRGKRNRPANVVHTLRLLAEQRGVEAAQLESQIEANAARVFRLPP